MKFMRLAVIAMTLLFFSSYAAAEYVGDVQFQKIHVANDWCYIQVMDDIPDTCSYFNYRFRFNTTTNQGKIMYSSLLMAKALKSNVDVWYTASSVPGTNENNGCSEVTMSQANALAFK